MDLLPANSAKRVTSELREGVLLECMLNSDLKAKISLLKNFYIPELTTLHSPPQLLVFK